MIAKETMNEIILGDCIKEMKKIKDEKVDLIFADPPYNMQLDKPLKRYNGTNFNGVNDDWDKFNSLEEYDRFSRKWLKEAFRILKPNGSLWTIGSFHNIHRLGFILQNMGAWIINEIVWEKSNPVPNFLGTRFVNSHETLLWVTKQKKSKYHFNYKTMKKINGGKQMKSVWKIPIANGNERLRNEIGEKIHSTQKPLTLVERIIMATTSYKDVVLDPFCGSGTTAHAAKKLGRKYICIEKEEKYYETSIKRLNSVIETKEKSLKMSLLDSKKPKVTFMNLIEKKYVTTSTKLTIQNEVFYFNNDATITHNEKKYTPNQLLKIIFKKPTNSWANIIVEKKPINNLREKYRKENF